MNSLDLNLYNNQLNQIMVEAGLSLDYGAEVKNCTNIHEVFKVLADREAKHVALLSNSAEPITDSMAYIKRQLRDNQCVPIAVFYEL